jgi:microcystin degradation protein MlrC
VAILQAVRSVVGPEPQVAVTLDLHANLAPQVVADSDLLVAYRTAPHRDAQETRERGAKLLVQCLESGVRPLSHLVKLPLLIAGEQAVTEVEPAQSLYRRLPHVDSVPGVLTCSILIGCAWTDSPYTSVSVLVSGTDGTSVRREASRLAQHVWDARAAFQVDSPTASIEESIRLASQSPLHPVFISDSGDNPTAGGTGDCPLFLERLVASGVGGGLVAGIADPDGVQRCFEAGVGRDLDLAIGAGYDSTFARPYRAHALVKRLVPQVDDIPPRALVQVGDVEVILQSSRSPFTTLHHFRSAGIDPTAKRIVVVKQGYLFPELRDAAPAHIMALSPGFTDLCLERLPFRCLTRPIYPLDPDVHWQADSQAIGAQ